MKHLPFHSIYRENFEVVEERQGHVRLFPHTAQLPIIHRALNLEFLGPLPGKLSRLDHRAKDLDLITRRTAAMLYCGVVNAARRDQVLLINLPDRQRVNRIAVVQHLRKETRLGLCHRFRFYAGPDFFPELYLNGKRIVFSDHAVDRLTTRIPGNLGSDLCDLLLTFYGTPMISVPLAGGRAFFVSLPPSLAAFPYKESEHEFFITTCLTIDQLHSFEVEFPPHAYNWHYDPVFTPPSVRHWSPTAAMAAFRKIWEHKAPIPEQKEAPKSIPWSRMAQWLPEISRREGHGPGSRIRFTDGVCGPSEVVYLPDQAEPAINELDGYKKAIPNQDWDAIFAEQLAPPDHYDRIKS